MLISSSALNTPPIEYGGLELVCSDLAKGLVELGHKVTVAAPIGSRLSEDVELIPTVDIEKERWREDLAYERYKKFLTRFDVVNDHSHSKRAAFHVRLSKKPINYCSTLHSPTSVLYPLTEPCLIGVSKYHAGYIAKRYGMSVKYVRNGLDGSRYTFQKDKSDRFLWIGRPIPGKGAVEAIKMCQKLNVPLDVITGDVVIEQITDYHVKIAQLCYMFSKWRYYGAVDNQRKIETMSKAKAFIFPLDATKFPEPFGLTVIEALAMGCPTVTYDCAAMREIVKYQVTGFLVKPGDTEGFMKAMKKIDQISPEECRKDFERRWSHLRLARDYLKLYEKVVGGNRW